MRKCVCAGGRMLVCVRACAPAHVQARHSAATTMPYMFYYARVVLLPIGKSQASLHPAICIHTNQ